MSPEIINQKEGITTATDIWSFGVCLWELVSREVPYKVLNLGRWFKGINLGDLGPHRVQDILHHFAVRLPAGNSGDVPHCVGQVRNDAGDIVESTLTCTYRVRSSQPVIMHTFQSATRLLASESTRAVGHEADPGRA